MPQEAEGCIWDWFVNDAPRPLYLQESAPVPILEKGPTAGLEVYAEK